MINFLDENPQEEESLLEEVHEKNDTIQELPETNSELLLDESLIFSNVFFHTCYRGVAN